MVPKLTKEEQNNQMKREAIICMIVYAGFFAWWFVTGYGLGLNDPEDYIYVMGLPLWFVLSVLGGMILFFAATIFVVKRLFRDFDLEESLSEEEE